MSDAAFGSTLKTSVEMLDAAEEAHSALEKEMQKALRTERAVCEREFRFPRMSKAEKWFWISFYTFLAGIFILILLLVPLAFYMSLNPGATVGPHLKVVLTVAALSMVVAFLISCFVIPMDQKEREREWIKLVLTGKFLVLVKTDVPGLELAEVYNRKRERGRIVFTFTIENIISLKPHIFGRVFRAFRNRDELMMLKLVRWGEVVEIKWSEELYYPVDGLASFIAELRRLGPHIKIHHRLEANR